MPGVYKIVCVPTKRSYIGSTKLLKTRSKDHLRQLREHRHDNSALQKDWDIYGETRFKFSVIERVKCFPWMLPIRLRQAEQKHMEKHTNLYNEVAAYKTSRGWLDYFRRWL
jgi:group I intron endonuclease